MLIAAKIKSTLHQVVTELHLFGSEHGGKETNDYLQKYEVHQYYFCFLEWTQTHYVTV